MADYNVNMKQWNGTSFDNVLPLAYNSHNAEQLGGQSLAEVQQWVKQWVEDRGLMLYTGEYIGTGTYGSREPTSVTFPFAPSIFFFPNQKHFPRANVSYGMLAISTLSLSSDYIDVRTPNNTSTSIYMKKSSDGKTITWYSESVDDQMNYSGLIYYYSAIGGYDMGVATEWTITSSGTWTVPRTGRYMLELYGGGGGVSDYTSIREGSAVQGGSSCQRYDSISLTAGDSIAVTIGVGGSTPLGGTTRPATGTSFGTYSVDGGGTGNGGTSTGGSGSGNLGTTGSVISYSTTNKFNNNNGTFGSLYGVGGWGGRSSSSSGVKSGTNGAVYLKYLGA